MKNGDVHNVLPRIKYEFWSPKVWYREMKVTKHFLHLWNQLKREEQWFEGLASITDIDKEMLKTIIKSSFLLEIPHIFAECAIMDNIISKYNSKVLVMTNEQMASGRAWVYEGVKHGVLTIGIQHGVISNHPAYFNHDSADVRVVDKKIENSFPVPDITCVWGETDAKLLRENAGYSDNQVIVTGNPRYDVLSNAQNLYSKVEFMKKYKINPESKIILWATQSHGMPMSENHQYFKEVFEACSTLSGITLIIKQHPNEGFIYTQLINEYISQYNLSIPIIVPDKMADTTELVYFSDIIINKFSTTGHEAVAFHKPMIIL